MSPTAITNAATPILNLIDLEQGAQASEMSRSMSMDSAPFPGGGGGGTDSFFDSGLAIPDYGTNLWIANWSMGTNTVTGIASNTLADVQYEILTITNLTSTNWNSQGFIFGSETTNWTPLNALVVDKTNNLFVRLKSWLTPPVPNS